MATTANTPTTNTPTGIVGAVSNSGQNNSSDFLTGFSNLATTLVNLATQWSSSQAQLDLIQTAQQNQVLQSNMANVDAAAQVEQSNNTKQITAYLVFGAVVIAGSFVIVKLLKK